MHHNNKQDTGMLQRKSTHLANRKRTLHITQRCFSVCALYTTALLFLCGMYTFAHGQSAQKRMRGEGLYQCISANTLGEKNLSAQGTLIGFIWDDKNSSPKPFPFLELKAEYGLTGFLSLVTVTRPVSYMWNKIPQFGYFGGGIKATLPNNLDLRFDGVGLEVLYLHSTLEKFPSLAGFRNDGTGFSPEGFLVKGGSIQPTLSYERDYIAELSNVPIKVFANAGCKIPIDSATFRYSQYRYALGLAYSGYSADVFVEYSCEAFFNTSTAPKTFNTLIPNKSWEVAFWENPHYITLGGRVRYENGVTLNACVPLLLSSNVGSANTFDDKILLSNSKNNPSGKFYDEAQRGVTDPFDPWYAKWRIIASITIPLIYNQTASEMRRSFLLVKNVKQNKTIRLDEKLDIKTKIKKQSEPADSLSKSTSDDSAKRLLEIRKRREALNGTQ